MFGFSKPGPATVVLTLPTKGVVVVFPGASNFRVGLLNLQTSLETARGRRGDGVVLFNKIRKDASAAPIGPRMASPERVAKDRRGLGTLYASTAQSLFS